MSLIYFLRLASGGEKEFELTRIDASFSSLASGIAHFTRRINKAISFCCANGEGESSIHSSFAESPRANQHASILTPSFLPPFPLPVAPFVGHNAFLRWSAVQDACFVDPDDKVTKIWSESHVSEDFDMSLRLQMKVGRALPFSFLRSPFVRKSLLQSSFFARRDTLFDGLPIVKADSRRECR